MKQTTFDELWPTLLKAWLIHIITLVAAFGIPVTIFVLSSFAADRSQAPDEWLFILGTVIPIFIASCIVSVIGPWRYLKKRGFKQSGLITVIGLVTGFLLPFGSILGFLGGGYLLERDARNKTPADQP